MLLLKWAKRAARKNKIMSGLTRKQLKIRKTGIGGSEAAYILGVGYSEDKKPFRTAHDVWLEKTGRKEPEDLSGNSSVEWGNLLESAVARKYSKETGKKFKKCKETLRHPQFEWMLGNIDRFIEGEDKILEIKTALFPGKNWGPSGSDIVPMPYIIQVQHYLAVTGFNHADLAVFIRGDAKNPFRIYPIKRDDDLINYMIEKLNIFWNEHVLKDMPPTGSL
jgi:putative phage-type endonuclease